MKIREDRSKFGEQRSNETRHGSHRTGLCLLPV